MDSPSPIALITSQITDLQIVKDYRVASAPEAVSANETLGKIKALGKQLDAAKDAEIRPLLERTKEVRDRYRPAETMLLDAEAVLKGALLNFRREEDRRLAAERAEAERVAAAERARLEEQARREREAAAAKAAKLEAAGKAEQAQAAIEAAEASARAKETVAAMASGVPAPQATQLAGFSGRSKWKGQVVDTRRFLASLSAAPGIDLDELVTFKQSGLDRLAALYKGRAGEAMPGMAATEHEIASVRAA